MFTIDNRSNIDRIKDRIDELKNLDNSINDSNYDFAKNSILQPLLRLGELKTEGSDEINPESEIKTLKEEREALIDLVEHNNQIIEPIINEIRILRDLNRKLVDKLLKLNQEIMQVWDRHDNQKMIIEEILRRLYAIEEEEFDTVPLSSTKMADMVEYQGYDKDVINALTLLEKKSTLFVSDLKRLEIRRNSSTQYERYLKKIGKISGNPVKKNSSRRWYVEKTEKKEGK